jgi:chromatin remodeling complex protein RSC6
MFMVLIASFQDFWQNLANISLQNPANKRNILCYAKLKAVLGKPEVTMFELTSLAGKHLS